MSLPSMGSLSHPARVMLGTEGKSAKSRNSEDDHHRKFEDYREVAFGVKGPRVTLTLGQVADMALGLEEITSHRPLSVLLRSAVQVKFQHTPHKQLLPGNKRNGSVVGLSKNDGRAGSSGWNSPETSVLGPRMQRPAVLYFQQLTPPPAREVRDSDEVVLSEVWSRVHENDSTQRAHGA
ncbi:hypothetical protein MMC16_001825 [Acarospora aff. strigata]|nr:hypothetical protein [Acarospora aff. strigata]